MSEESKLPAVLMVDLKKSRIRIYKSTLRQIGNPDYIQLLVNPGNMAVAIRGVEKDSPGDQTHRIGRMSKYPGFAVEIHSKIFMEKLCSIVEGLDFGHNYHISGMVLPSQKMAVYSLKTLRKSPKEGAAE